MTQTPVGYEEDLAYIHDVGYDFHARGLESGLLKVLRKAGLAGSVVVDLGCGSGIWAAALVAAGFSPEGVDVSPAMIALAKQRAPNAEFHVASFVDFDFPPCGAITAFGEVLCYQLDRRNNRRALSRLIRRAHKALAPGGLFLFDIAELGLNRGMRPTCRAGRDWACLVSFEYNDRRDQLIRQIETFRQVGELYRRGHETHRVQLYDRRAIARLLREAGFRVQTFERLGRYELLSKRCGFIARKAT